MCDDSIGKTKIQFTDDYRKWRNIQREQLGISANLYMIFSSASIGFVLNLLLDKERHFTLFLKKDLFIGKYLILVKFRE